MKSLVPRFSLTTLVLGAAMLAATTQVASAAEKFKWPEYSNGMELMTKLDGDNNGVSDLLTAGAYMSFKKNVHVVIAATASFKAKIDLLQTVKDGKKLTDAQFYAYSVANKCVSDVIVYTQPEVNTSDEFDWEDTVFNWAFPQAEVNVNENLRAALADYSQLTTKYGQQFEARKKKLKRPPEGMEATCEAAGVHLSIFKQKNSSSQSGASGLTVTKYTKVQLVTKTGAPTDLGIAQGYQEFIWNNLRAMGQSHIATNNISAGRNLGCKADGRNWVCDWSAIAKTSNGDDKRMGHNRFIWSDEKWTMVD